MENHRKEDREIQMKNDQRPLCCSCHSCSLNYDRAIEWCQQVIYSPSIKRNHNNKQEENWVLFHTDEYKRAITEASETFGYSVEAMSSLLRNLHLLHVKKQTYKVRNTNNSNTILQMYVWDKKSILEISRKINFSPYMTTKVLLELLIMKKPLLLSTTSTTSTSAPNTISMNAVNKSMGDSKSGRRRRNNNNTINSNTNNNVDAQIMQQKQQPSKPPPSQQQQKPSVKFIMRNPVFALGNKQNLLQNILPPQYHTSEYTEEEVRSQQQYQELPLQYQSKNLSNHSLSSPMRSVNETDRIPPTSLKEVNDLYYSNPNNTSRLAREVHRAINLDPIYGPEKDRQRRQMGEDYEVKLEQTLKSLGIPFETESQLRERGTARTPDIILPVPLAIKLRVVNNKSKKKKSFNNQNHYDCEYNNDHSDEDIKEGGENCFVWRTIYWIDSKAMFGDENTHHSDVLPQAEAFANRFGPGLILYWFGHAPKSRLHDLYGNVSVLAWDFFGYPDRYQESTTKVDGTTTATNLENKEMVMLPNGRLIVRK